MAESQRSYHHGNLRQALLDAALEITRTGGASALVLRDVTRRVGVSPNAAYRHFASREDLLRAASQRIQVLISERMAPDGSGAGPRRSEGARSRLRAIGLGYIAFALAEPGWFDVAFVNVGALYASGEPIRAEEMPSPVRLLLAALDDLVEEGELAPDRRHGAEWPCWSAVHGLAIMALHGPLRAQSRAAIDAAAERTVDAVVDGLLGPSGAAAGARR